MFCQLKDKYELYNEFNISWKKCYSCGDEGHFILNCPLLAFQKMSIKKYYENKEYQIRAPHQRVRKKIKIMNNFSDFQAKCRNFGKENTHSCKIYVFVLKIIFV